MKKGTDGRRMSRQEVRDSKRRRGIQTIQSILADTLDLESTAPTPTHGEHDTIPPSLPSTPPTPTGIEPPSSVVRQTPSATTRDVLVAAPSRRNDLESVNGRVLMALKRKLFRFVMIVAGKIGEKNPTEYWFHSDVFQVAYNNEAAEASGASTQSLTSISASQPIGAAVGVTHPVGRSNLMGSVRAANIVSGQDFLMGLMKQKSLSSADIAAWKLIFESSAGSDGIGMSTRMAILSGVTLEQAFVNTYLAPPFYAAVDTSLDEVHTNSGRREITLHDLIYSNELSPKFADLVTINYTLDRITQSRTEHASRTRSLMIKKQALIVHFRNVSYLKPSPERTSDGDYPETLVVSPTPLSMF